MNTTQLISLLKKDKYSKKQFCGVVPIDKLSSIKLKKPCGLIINNQNSSLPGEHWFSIYIPTKGNIEYFDSYGRKPLNKEVYDFFKVNNMRYIYNKFPIQDVNSINCGKYCVFYIYMRTRGFKLAKILKFFLRNKKTNDVLIDTLFNKIKYM